MVKGMCGRQTEGHGGEGARDEGPRGRERIRKGEVDCGVGGRVFLPLGKWKEGMGAL